MCGRYISVQTIEKLEKRFNLSPTPETVTYEPSYNIGPGKLAPVITNDKPKELQMLTFGLTPFWAKKKMYLINARAEGDNNQDNNTTYTGAKGIILKPAFRKPIRSQRCLVIADAFYEGPEKEKLDKPYMVYLKNKVRPFAMAGIWDTWIYKDEEGEEKEYKSFAIITTVANSILQKIGHHRSPVILKRNEEIYWLKDSLPLSEATAMLLPYNDELMNAYPVSTAVKNPRNEGKELIEPTGQRLVPEFNIKVETKLELQGMGNRKKYERESSIPWYERNKGEVISNYKPDLSELTMAKQNFKTGNAEYIKLFYDCSGCGYRIETDEIDVSKVELVTKVTEQCYECGTGHNISIEFDGKGGGIVQSYEIKEGSTIDIVPVD